MTKEKQKALELVDQYVRLVPEDFGGMNKDLAKQCAIIAVDEKLKLLSELIPYGIDYLQKRDELLELKKEIENL